jgi:SSS family solute:Na+ symporter
MNLSIIDISIFAGYCLLILGIGLFVSKNKKGQKKDSSDYFLAGRGLAWWAIGASIIASNISAEQFIGMSGSGYAIGLAMATYEWIAALGLIIVAKWFLPIFLQKRIYTMPQFLEQRFDARVKTVMTIFWLAVFIFINLTSIMYLGALTIKNVMGIPLMQGVLFLALFAGIYSIYGGLKAVAITDVVQVVFLIGGGLITTYIAINALGAGEGLIKGFNNLYETSHDRFHLILDSSHPGYKDLPGLSVIVGGLWVANLYYWGCNQYIIQRALAAKSVDEAQKGMQFAGLLKLLIPLIVVIPGIAVYAMGVELGKSDEAYPWLLSHLIPTGIKGLTFAALIAAIVSSLASMMNSISTIFTMDIYKPYIEKKASEGKLVKVGRLSSFAALLIAIAIVPMLTTLDQAFQYIQEFTGFISPGALAIFLTGFFYKRATPNGALLAAIGTFVFSTAMKFTFPGLPWMDRMLIVFILCVLTVFITAIVERKGVNVKAIEITPGLFKTSRAFNIIAVVIMAILIVLYTIWW